MRQAPGFRSIAALLTVVATLASCHTQDAGGVSYRRIAAGDYQTFVKNWDDAKQPVRYALIQSPAQYAAIFKPAAVMGMNRPFAPADGAFDKEQMLLVARVMPAGDMASAFDVERITRTNDELQLHYRYHAPPAASSTVKNYLAAWIPKRDTRKVTFFENGKSIGALNVAQGEWSVPGER